MLEIKRIELLSYARESRIPLNSLLRPDLFVLVFPTSLLLGLLRASDTLLSQRGLEPLELRRWHYGQSVESVQERVPCPAFELLSNARIWTVGRKKIRYLIGADPTIFQAFVDDAQAVGGGRSTAVRARPGYLRFISPFATRYWRHPSPFGTISSRWTSYGIHGAFDR